MDKQEREKLALLAGKIKSDGMVSVYYDMISAFPEIEHDANLVYVINEQSIFYHELYLNIMNKYFDNEWTYELPGDECHALAMLLKDNRSHIEELFSDVFTHGDFYYDYDVDDIIQTQEWKDGIQTIKEEYGIDLTKIA